MVIPEDSTRSRSAFQASGSAGLDSWRVRDWSIRPQPLDSGILHVRRIKGQNWGWKQLCARDGGICGDEEITGARCGR